MAALVHGCAFSLERRRLDLVDRRLARLELLALLDELLGVVELSPQLVRPRRVAWVRRAFPATRPPAGPRPASAGVAAFGRPLPRLRASRRSRRRGSSRARRYPSPAFCLAPAPAPPKRRPQARPIQTVGRSDSGR